MKKISKYIDFSFKKTDLIAIIALICCSLYIFLFNISEIYENTLLENMQLLPFMAGIVVCLKAKNNKPFFIIAALILFLLFLRELSYGRVFFGAVPGSPNEFYPLSHFKYGYLVNVFIGIYIALILLFTIFKRVWVDIIQIIKKIKFPVWTFLGIFVFIVLEIFGEKADNTIIEEISELVIYCLTLSLCFTYTAKNNDT